METKDQKTPESEAHAAETQKEEKPTENRSDALDELQKGELQSENESSNNGPLNVIAPTPHDFPTFGIAETDFLPSDNGRTTGRMIDHEPGQ